MQSKILQDISEITFGYSFREAIEVSQGGNIRVIQARNISSDSAFEDLSELEFVQLDSTRSEAFVNRGDILITSRGATVGGFKVTLFNCESNIPVLASSSLFVLHKVKEVLPEYLVAYLNSNAGQRQLQDRATGATVRSILRSELGKIEIPIPPTEKQQSIVALERNIKQQNKLLDRRIALNNQLIDGTINSINS